MAGMLSVTRDAASGIWTLAPAAGRDWVSPVIPESIRREGKVETLNLRRHGWRGQAQAWEVTVSIINVRNEDNIDGLFGAMVTDVSDIKPFIFQWPQVQEGTGTDGGALAAAGVVGDNEMTFASVVPPPSVGRLVNFAPLGKLYQVQYAPTGDQAANYTVGIEPRLTHAVRSTQLIRALQPKTMAYFLEKPTLPTNRSIVFETTFTVREQPPA